MRGQLDRIEKLERVANVECQQGEPFHLHFYSPSKNGPLLVGALGPMVIGGDGSVTPIRLDREPDETEADFLRRAELVFSKCHSDEL